MTVWKKINKIREKGDDEFTLYFLLRTRPDAVTFPRRPGIFMELEGPWSRREQLMGYWNTAVGSLRNVSAPPR
jgi:hypothetical protein